MSTTMQWDPRALARIGKVPFFVRGLAKKKAEAAAKERGMTTVTVELLDEIKKQAMG